MCCLEIILVVVLGRSIANRCLDNGRSATGGVILLILLFFGGEFIGAFIGALLTEGRVTGVVYLCAVMGAAAGAVTTFAIVNSLSPGESVEAYYRRISAEQMPRLPDERYREKFGEFRERGHQAPWQRPDDDPGQYHKDEQ
jgi:hypothetical protein